MKAVVAAFNQEKALVGAFSVITNLRMELFEALTSASPDNSPLPGIPVLSPRKGQTWGSPDCWQSLYRDAGATLHHVTMLRVTHNLLPSRLNCCANCSVQSYYRIILRHIVKVYLAQHKVHRDSVSTMGSVVQNMSHGTWFSQSCLWHTPSSFISLNLSEIEIQQLKNIYYAGQCVAWSSLSCRLDPVTVVLC